MRQINDPPPAKGIIPRRAVPPSALAAALHDVVCPPADSERPDAPGALFVAVVHTVEDILLVAASTLREEVVRQLANYVSRCARDTLLANDAARVRALLAARKPAAAIAHYFATVGRRWDMEWLVSARVSAGAIADQVLALEQLRRTGTVYSAIADDRRVAESGR